ncbi:MAG: carboxypeptidase regulatory-like domain-containing protein [Bacteroidetes bacterium]|nr:MAG: carboxypeptidase regulatory-like domain-containing protein [Bacteroidota bacterium]
MEWKKKKCYQTTISCSRRILGISLLKYWTLLWFLFTFSQNISCQEVLICGNVIDKLSNSPISKAEITLLDSLENELDTVYSDNHGDFSIEVNPREEYQLLCRVERYIPMMYTSIKIDSDHDTTYVNFELAQFKDCSNDKTTIFCPFCTKNKRVLRIVPGMVVSYNFGNDPKKIRRYERERNRRGYEKTYTKEGEEVVWSVRIDEERDKFYDLQHC